MSRLSDLEHRDREHANTIRRLRKQVDEQDRRIRELQQRLGFLNGVAGLLPIEYASELHALASIAFDGPPSSGDLANVQTGKPQSTGTRLPNPAYRSIQSEMQLLRRRAARDDTGRPIGALARSVDRSANDAQEQNAA